MLFTDDDLATYMQVDTVDVARYALLADLVEGLITDEIGAVADPTPSGVLAVALEATARAYRNPDGVISETVDDYTIRRSDATPGVYLTGAELRRLHVSTGTTFSRSVALSPSWRIAPN